MKFEDALKKKYGEKYDYITVSEVELMPTEHCVRILFTLPKTCQAQFSDADKETVDDIARLCVSPDFILFTRYRYGVIDAAVIEKIVKDFICENFPGAGMRFDPTELKTETGESATRVSVAVSRVLYDFFRAVDFCAKLEERLEREFASEIKVCLEVSEKALDIPLPQRTVETAYISGGDVETSFHKRISGAEIVERARQIYKFDKPKADVCVCGRVKELARLLSKKKNKLYFTFKLDDTTGVMSCIYFGRSSEKCCLDCLKNDDEVIVVGQLDEDSFRGGLILRIERLSLCKIDFDAILPPNFMENELRRQRQAAADAFKSTLRVEPIAYRDEEVAGDNLYEFGARYSDFISGTDFVVFDLETTGLDVDTTAVIEIGAVKIRGGKITDYFSTLVDPRIHIPPDASNVNHIYDADVTDAPYIETVVRDFDDYCRGCTLVAHNGFKFDFKILERVYRENSLGFDFKLMDTLYLAQKLNNGPRNNKLGTLCDAFGISLVGAHRAYNDAEATAKLFLALTRKLGM